MESQIKQVLAHFKKHKKLTSWDCITRYRITRLAAYVCVLKESHNIVSVRITDKTTGKWWVEYKYMGAK